MAHSEHSAVAQAAQSIDASAGMAARACTPLDVAVALVVALPPSLDRHVAICAGHQYAEVVRSARLVAQQTQSKIVREHLLADAARLEREGSLRVLAIGRVRG